MKTGLALRETVRRRSRVPMRRPTRSERVRRRAERTYWIIVASTFGVLGGVFFSLTPRQSEKPLITLYMLPGCDTCEAYFEYLQKHGFRVVRGGSADLAGVRARFRLPRSFRAPQTGVISGLYVEGHVPAADIRDLIAKRNRGRALGLVVPGRPRWAPGLSTGLPEPFTVYMVQPSGLLQPLITYNDQLHFN
jgi:hypothetical protein